MNEFLPIIIGKEIQVIFLSPVAVFHRSGCGIVRCARLKSRHRGFLFSAVWKSYAAKQGLKEYFEEGETGKWARHTRVMNAIRKGVDDFGFKEALSRDVQSGLVSAICYPDDPNWSFEKVHDYCYERGFTIYPGKMQNQGTFRLCALGAIDEQDIKDFWVVFKEALDKTGVKTPVKYN